MLHYVDLDEQGQGADSDKERQELAKQLIESGDPEFVKLGKKIQNFTTMEEFDEIMASLMEFQQKYDMEKIMGDETKQDM